MRKILFLLAAVLLALTAQARDRQSFDKNWRFTLGDSIIMSKTDFDDSRWRLLDVPHDWAIEGDFYVSNPSGAGGGALPGGIGWYRKHFFITKNEELRTKSYDYSAADNSRSVSNHNSSLFTLNSKFYIEFDGVYMNSTVYVNGREVGHRPYGYSSFEYDITPFVTSPTPVGTLVVVSTVMCGSRRLLPSMWLTGVSLPVLLSSKAKVVLISMSRSTIPQRGRPLL